MNRNSNKKSSLLICLTLGLVTFAVFYQVYSFAFITFDDSDYVYNNPNIQSGITLKAVKWAFTTGFAANWHPLTWLSHMLDWQLFGNDAGGHHLTNLFIHIANTLLLFIVLWQMTSALWQSAFAAALFALHPLHVESVAWIAERKDVLSAFFWILTMWAYLRYVKRPGFTRYMLIVLTFALGLMSKPMLVTLPFVLLLLDYWPLERLERRTVYRLVLEKIPLFILSAASSIITFIVQHSGRAVASLDAFSLKFRVFNAVISYFEYIRKMFWPDKLAFFYPVSTQYVSLSYAVISAGILLAATVLVLQYAKNHRYLVTGWFWYLGTLVPVIGFVQVGAQALADRYTYITLTGLFIIVTWGVSELFGKLPHRKIILWPISLIVLSALAICAYLQTRYWKDSITLYEHAIKVTENNYMAHLSMTEPLVKQGRFEEAISHNTEAVRIKPDNLYAINNLGVSFYKAGRTDEAVGCFEKVLKMDPAFTDAHCNMAIILKDKGDYAGAAEHYRIAMKSNDMPSLHGKLGFALLKLGLFQEAAKEYEKMLLFEPNNATAHSNLGYVLAAVGKLDEAVGHYNEAMRFNPEDAATNYQLALILAKMNKINQAVEHFKEAMRLKPDWDEPANILAWYFAVNKETGIYNPDEAVRLAQHACQLTNYQKPDFLDTLAVAYAAKGDFGKAVETIEKALALCQSPQQESLKKELESRLTLFKAGKPYVEN